MKKSLAIIGAGPSALAAAIYTTREDIPTVLYEKGVVGGLAAITDKVENYPGFPSGVEGMMLANQFQSQAERFGADIEFGEVSSVKKLNNEIEIIVDNKPILADAVLIATGSSYKKTGMPGEDDFYGKGVHYCATCDGAFYRDKKIAVIGGGNSAIQEAIFLTRFASHIDLLVRSKIRASDVLQKELKKYIDEGKITVHLKTTPQKILSLEGKINGIEINQEDDIKQLEVEGVFVFIGLNPNTEFLQGSGIELDEQGLIKTNSRLETNIPGIFASGDVRSGSTMQIASAVGEGASAALSIREYLESQKH
ncbi:FAD-dependent oxidoreductase [Candidatus Saccharibacteria bacterium]|jgi:FAD-dependent pyridine nucleotide-disulphide oxidoreductase|nr:FAD-dependent oxidoreductase [Candidatus Saccharibacteria bacterium]